MNRLPSDIEHIIHSFTSIEDAVIREYPINYIQKAYDISFEDIFILCARYGKLGMMRKLLPLVDLLRPVYCGAFDSDISLYWASLYEAALFKRDESFTFLLNLDLPIVFGEFSEVYFLVDNDYATLIADRIVNDLTRDEINSMLSDAVGFRDPRRIEYWIGMGADTSLYY